MTGTKLHIYNNHVFVATHFRYVRSEQLMGVATVGIRIIAMRHNKISSVSLPVCKLRFRMDSYSLKLSIHAMVSSADYTDFVLEIPY